MQYLEQKRRNKKNSRTLTYAKIFSGLFFTLSTSLKPILKSYFMQYLEQKRLNKKDSRPLELRVVVFLWLLKIAVGSCVKEVDNVG